MKRFYLAYSDESIWRQPVAKLFKSLSLGQSPIWQQAVAKLDESPTITDFLRQLIAQVPWDHEYRLPTAKQPADAMRAALSSL